MSGLGAHPARDALLRDVATDVGQVIITTIATSGEEILDLLAEGHTYVQTSVNLDAPENEARKKLFEQLNLPESLSFDLVLDEQQGPKIAGYAPAVVERVEGVALALGPNRSIGLLSIRDWRPVGPGNTLFFNVLPPDAWERVERNPEVVWARILRLLDHQSDSIIHEVTHMLDNLRGRGFMRRKRAAHPEQGYGGYYNDSAEFNAHFQQGMFILRSKLEDMNERDREWVMRSFDNFERAADNIFYLGNMRKYLNSKMERRYVVRLRQTYDHWKESE